jgi:hypothetical protein
MTWEPLLTRDFPISTKSFPGRSWARHISHRTQGFRLSLRVLVQASTDTCAVKKGPAGRRTGRVWAAPEFWGPAAVGGACGLTVVTTAPPRPRPAGLRTVTAFRCEGPLAQVPGSNPAGLWDILNLPTPPPPPCKGRTPDTSKGNRSPRLDPPPYRGAEGSLRCSWAKLV